MHKKRIDIPDTVFKLIRINIKSFIKAGYFKNNEKEDLEQILLLFYLENVQKLKLHSFSESELFVSFKNKLWDIVRYNNASMRNRRLDCSLEELEAGGFQFSNGDSFKDIENRLVVQELLKILPDRERCICQRILDGATIENIVNEFHVSYSTVPKIFKKIREFINSE